MHITSAEILCVGTELLMGDVVNTNAAVIAKELAALGINVYHQTVVGDNPGRLTEALHLAFSRSDLVITTGGLGPTYDDLTKEIIAQYFGRKLVFHEESWRRIEAYFSRLQCSFTQNNRKQAMMPEGCTVFENRCGTAPGCALEGNGKMAIMLPGPPREMKPMLLEQALPYIRKDSDTHLVSRNLHFFGIGESALEQRLHDMMVEAVNPTIAPYAKTGEVMLRVTARVRDGEDPTPLLEPVVNRIKEEAGQYLYSETDGDLQSALVHLLRDKGLTAATAESCTGGLVAKRITEVSGASQVFQCGMVTYSNGMKEKMRGVARETLNTYSAVSPETAGEMAAGARRFSGADLAVAVTGNAGPEPSEGKPVGLVYVAVDSSWHKEVLELKLNRRDGDARELIRYLASSHALHLLLRTAQKYPGVSGISKEQEAQAIG